MKKNNNTYRHAPLFDRIFAFAIAIILSPILLGLLIHSLLATGKIFKKFPYIISQKEAIFLLHFAKHSRISHWAKLYNMIKGDVQFIGPELSADDNHQQLQAQAAAINLDISQIPPGLISVSMLHKLSGLGFEMSKLEQYQFYSQLTVKNKLSLLTRYMFSRLFFDTEGLVEHRVFHLLDVRIDNYSMHDAISKICENASLSKPSKVYFVNAHSINIAANDSQFQQILNQSLLTLPDGSGVKIAAKMKKVAVKENVNGTDLLPLLCESMIDSKLKLFMLGAKPGVAEDAAKNLQRKFPALEIVGVQHGYFSQQKTPEVLNSINESGAHIVLVAMGVPMQERWIDQHSPSINTATCIGVGGQFDFFAERVSRAPLWLREMGMEWIWRLKEEPSRMWKRYVLGNPAFILRAIIDTVRS